MGKQDGFDEEVSTDLHIRPITRNRGRSGKIWPRIVQIDLWGKPVLPSRLRMRSWVSSYKKKSGFMVRPHFRQKDDCVVTRPSTPRVSSKKLTGADAACQESVNLAHSLYVENLRAEIRSVGQYRCPRDPDGEVV